MNMPVFCAAFPRTFEILSTTVPVGDRVNESPFHTTEVGDGGVADTFAACGVPELSTVRLTSTVPSGWIRLVSFTVKNRLRLPETVALGAPPEQVNMMSPKRSATPSA